MKSLVFFHLINKTNCFGQWVCSKLDVEDQLPLLILRKVETFRIKNKVGPTASFPAADVH